MTGVDRGVIRPRWADLVDSDGEAAAGDVCVTVRLDGGGSACVVMESRDSIADLNVWIEKNPGIATQLLRSQPRRAVHRPPSADVYFCPSVCIAPRLPNQGRPASGDAPDALQFSR